MINIETLFHFLTVLENMPQKCHLTFILCFCLEYQNRKLPPVPESCKYTILMFMLFRTMGMSKSSASYVIRLSTIPYYYGEFITGILEENILEDILEENRY